MARKSATGAARKDEMIRWLFENSRDLMQVIGADGRFKLVNGAWGALTGWAEHEPSPGLSVVRTGREVVGGEARVRGVLPVTRRCMAWRGRTARRATVS